jgi:hypothetical protein
MLYLQFIVQETDQVNDLVFQSYPSEPTISFVIYCKFLQREFDRTRALHAFHDVLSSGGKTYLWPQNADPLGNWILDCDKLKASYPRSQPLQEVEWLAGEIVVAPEYEFVPTGDSRGRGTQVTFTLIQPTEVH